MAQRRLASVAARPAPPGGAPVRTRPGRLRSVPSRSGIPPTAARHPHSAALPTPCSGTRSVASSPGHRPAAAPSRPGARTSRRRRAGAFHAGSVAWEIIPAGPALGACPARCSLPRRPALTVPGSRS